MENSVLVPRNARKALATWLADEEFERPQTVHPEVWRQLLHAECACLDYVLLGELVDVLSPTVLDLIRWPAKRGERL